MAAFVVFLTQVSNVHSGLFVLLPLWLFVVQPVF